MLDDLVAAGKIRHYGVSVERVDDALEAIRHPGVKTVQVIFNMFRLKPSERVFAAARVADVGVLARVPLASGLLTGKLTKTSQFAADDHRAFNREGEAFDKGETFSGVPYEVGLAAVEELQLRALEPWLAAAPAGAKGATLAQLALRWILMFDAVTCAIPGAKTPEQARANAAAASLPPLDDSTMAVVREAYDSRIRQYVQGSW
jgi:aryl-alcohol dehydrogenase-like predicted oxidoreductase